MYQPNQLNDLIHQARLNGHREIYSNLLKAQAAMQLQNAIETTEPNVKLGWRSKCESELTLEDLG